MCCAGSAHWHSASQWAGPGGPARRRGMHGLPPWLHAWRWRTWQCLVWPPTQVGALLWRHMHMVYKQHKAKEINSLGPEKLVCYIRSLYIEFPLYNKQFWPVPIKSITLFCIVFHYWNNKQNFPVPRTSLYRVSTVDIFNAKAFCCESEYAIKKQTNH